MSAKKRILMVDDDKDYLDLTRNVLEHEGYEVSTALDGASGLAMAKTVHPHLLLLDVMMNSSSEGFDISRELRHVRELKDLPVIILTGIRDVMGLGFHFEPDDTWLPAQAVLEKPIAPERLVAEIKKCLFEKKKGGKETSAMEECKS